MGLIRIIIQILIISLFGAGKGPTHDLRKKPTKEDHMRTLNCFIQRYFYIFVAIFIMLLFITFVCVCFASVGASGVESGNYYNHIQEVI